MTRADDALALRTPPQGASSLREIDANVVLLDIEGTISPLSFVRDVLFAYSRERLATFVADHRGDEVVETLLEQAASLSGGADPVAALVDWQDRDVKAPPLKKLQGLIWERGYQAGELRGIVYDDVPRAVRRWHAAIRERPATRRAYLDRSLTRLLPARGELPLEYGSTVGQRNACLRRLRAGVSSPDALQPWTEAVVAVGTSLVDARREAVSLLHEPFSRIASATAIACSLIASCAVSRPTLLRTAAINTLVVARNGR